MPVFQVTCSELVHIDRTYEIEAETAAEAVARMSRGGVGQLVDEQIQGTHDFCGVKHVYDEHGNSAT